MNKYPASGRLTCLLTAPRSNAWLSLNLLSHYIFTTASLLKLDIQDAFDPKSLSLPQRVVWIYLFNYLLSGDDRVNVGGVCMLRKLQKWRYISRKNAPGKETFVQIEYKAFVADQALLRYITTATLDNGSSIITTTTTTNIIAATTTTTLTTTVTVATTLTTTYSTTTTPPTTANITPTTTTANTHCYDHRTHTRAHSLPTRDRAAAITTRAPIETRGRYGQRGKWVP